VRLRDEIYESLYYQGSEDDFYWMRAATKFTIAGLLLLGDPGLPLSAPEGAAKGPGDHEEPGGGNQ